MSQTSYSSDRLELLLFDLGGQQKFGINVLKIREIIPCTTLTQMPQSHVAIRGIAHLRGSPLTVIELARVIRRGEILEDVCQGSIIISELNRGTQGFLVHKVDRIVHCEWRDVLPPPAATSTSSYITGVAHIDGTLVQILDVEKIIGEVVESVEDTAEIHFSEGRLAKLHGRRVLVVDDSVVARRQTAQTLEPLGILCIMAGNGKEALAVLRKQLEDEKLVDMVLSDIEMPIMDGYQLVREIRNVAGLQHLYVLLHTSLNGAINTEKASRAGANQVLTKFVPSELALAVATGLGA